MAKSGKKESDKQRFRLCVPPCPRFITGGDTHVACLGAEHALSVLEGAGCPHCVCLLMWTLHSQRALFEEGALTSVPRGSGPASADAERSLKSWGSQVDLAERMETGTSFSSSSPARSSAHSLGTEARSETVSSVEARSETVSSAPKEGSCQGAGLIWVCLCCCVLVCLEHMAVSWYLCLPCALLSIVTPPLLLPYYLVRVNTCFR